MTCVIVQFKGAFWVPTHPGHHYEWTRLTKFINKYEAHFNSFNCSLLRYVSPLSHSLCLGLRQEWSRLERNMLSHQRPEPCQYQPTFCVRRYSLSPDCLVPSIKFNYIVVQGASLVNDGNNLKMMADFGYVEYKGVVYNAQEMYILSPS